MKRSVRDLLRQRNFKNFPFVNQEATVEEALLACRKFRSRTVLVMKGQSLAGLFAETDYAKIAIESKGMAGLASKVADFMTRKIVYVSPEYKLNECLAVMTKMDIRALPVMENEKPIALLSMKHITEALIEDQEFLISQLVQYMTGSNIPEPSAVPKTRVQTHTISDGQNIQTRHTGLMNSNKA